MFFLATADADGRPDCSYKGGHPGFVRVSAPSELAFPSYDGNGMFRSLGNVRSNAAVGLLFLDFDQPRRLRVNGTATFSEDDPLMSQFAGAQLIVRVRAEQIFPNCPRYLHRMKLVELSAYAPRDGDTAPIPAWKKMPQFNDVLAPGDPARET
jgi:predicted pyridoxine 5'-phosphate oxidase superfamily flavin-nucleotide-binding protein